MSAHTQIGEQDASRLVARIQAGDQDAFAELVRRHSDHVFRLALSILGPGFVTEAEDVAQDVFLKVHHALAGFRQEAEISSWIYRITFNHALNVKAHSRYRRPHVDDSILFLTADAQTGQHTALETSERDRTLAACMQSLPEVYQSSLRLYYWLGASVGEAAALLDVPENTVKSYLYRARQLLAAMLKEKGYSHA
jgi:RNA polymerase sigma-70 factor, ECF subfamily